MNNFLVPIVDTDSATICKPDFAEFTQEEINKLTIELNEQFDDLISWEFEFYIPKIICIKAKNYILFDGKDFKIKGSALKATTKSPALKELLKKVIHYLVHNDNIVESDLISIYNGYVEEIKNIIDIKRWSARKTISERTLNSERSNEAKVRIAIEGSEINEGDRCYVFYKQDDSLCLVQNFNGDYNKTRLLKNLFDTIKVFENVLPNYKTMFKNYSLKKNYKELFSNDNN